jgi:transcriptional regulator with XRE-family HTH domain
MMHMPPQDGPTEGTPVSDGFGRQAGRVLRRARLSRGLTLRDVGVRSDGAFKATAVAGYERGERAISLARFIELCAVYEIPPQRLLAEVMREVEGRGLVNVDLGRLERLESREAAAVAEFVRQVRSARGERSTTVAIRSGDLAVIATAAGSKEDVLLEKIAPAITSAGPLDQMPLR